MAARLRMVQGSKRAGKKRPARKKRTRFGILALAERSARNRRRNRLGIFALAMLGALIMGFLAKRVMIPSAVHYIAYRPPDRPQPPSEANPPDASEQLTPSDRRQLDTIIKEKNKP